MGLCTKLSILIEIHSHKPWSEQTYSNYYSFYKSSLSFFSFFLGIFLGISVGNSAPIFLLLVVLWVYDYEYLMQKYSEKLKTTKTNNIIKQTFSLVLRQL